MNWESSFFLLKNTDKDDWLSISSTKVHLTALIKTDTCLKSNPVELSSSSEELDYEDESDNNTLSDSLDVEGSTTFLAKAFLMP